MAYGKNKRLSKKGKGRKKKADAFEKKEWFRLRLPKVSTIEVENYGWTCANKTAQGITVQDRLYNRICTIRCGDLKKTPKADPKPEEEDHTTATNLKLRIAQTDLNTKEVLLDFYGMELTRDKRCSMLKKWVTLVEATQDVRTADGFVYRLFAMALTKKQDQQCKKTAYAKTSQVKRIRFKMKELMREVFSDSNNTRDFVHNILVDKCGDKFKAELKSIFPIRHACIRKVKLIKRPNKEDLRRIADLHTNPIAEEPKPEDVDMN